jgi:TPR repeat protein
VALACKHFEKAHACGFPDAALYLGTIYSYGNGIERDIERAKQCLESAAAAEYFYAYGRLARIAFDEKKFVKSVQLLIKGYLVGKKVLGGDPLDPRRLGINVVGTLPSRSDDEANGV